MSVTKRKKPNQPVSEPPAAQPYQPTAQELEAAKALLARRAARTPVPRVKLEPLPGGGAYIGPDHPMPALWAMALQQVFGTVSLDFAALMLGELSDAATIDRDTVDEKTANGILGALHGINPQDEVEAMLASQMVATHLAAMRCLRRAQAPGQTFEGRDMNLRHATKLSRTYTMQVESLKRYRSKGEQRVVVQHQHVNVTAERAAVQVNGGVDPAPRGRGAASKPEERSHAPQAPRSIAFEPGAPMSCPDPPRDAMPAAVSERESPLSNARWG
jgi:hypothetical protein